MTIRVLDNISDLRAWRQDPSLASQRVAFVPTMGNLHEGHLALMRLAQKHAPVVIASIFVNPMQFGAGEDYERYPRTLAEDCEKLSQCNVTAVFTPTVDMIYPEGVDQHTRIHVPGLSNILCGAHRPGHFDGVATIVTKLLNLVQPNIAVFGEKDYQQLVIIRKMISDLALPVDIVGAPICREPDGLAMSSRNQYLSPEERAIAPKLYQTLKQVVEKSATTRDWQQLSTWARETLTAYGFAVDYVEIRRQGDLAQPTPDDKALVVLAAAKLGQTRLIDNISFTCS